MSLKQKYFTESIFYQADITANILDYKKKVYLGVSETTFNVRNGNHNGNNSNNGYLNVTMVTFTKQRHKSDTELSKDY